MTAPVPPLRVEDYRRSARARLDDRIWDFVEAGAESERTVRANRRAFGRAPVGGFLVEAGCSLRAAGKEKTEFYRRNLRTLLGALGRSFAEVAGVRWNTPAGGFFVVVDVPLTADEELLETSARDYGVLWTPMSFFYGGGAGDKGRRAMRLSCSALEPALVEEGVRRLAELVKDRSDVRGRP